MVFNLFKRGEKKMIKLYKSLIICNFSSLYSMEKENSINKNFTNNLNFNFRNSQSSNKEYFSKNYIYKQNEINTKIGISSIFTNFNIEEIRKNNKNIIDLDEDNIDEYNIYEKEINDYVNRGIDFFKDKKQKNNLNIFLKDFNAFFNNFIFTIYKDEDYLELYNNLFLNNFIDVLSNNNEKIDQLKIEDFLKYNEDEYNKKNKENENLSNFINTTISMINNLKFIDIFYNYLYSGLNKRNKIEYIKNNDKFSNVLLNESYTEITTLKKILNNNIKLNHTKMKSYIKFLSISYRIFKKTNFNENDKILINQLYNNLDQKIKKSNKN